MEKVYLGAAYYPELWTEEELDKDILRMKELGVNCMRIGEFAWSKMEPKEGEFDFSFFEKVVDKLYENGIDTVMCTPSCTPPRWLFKKYPETLQTNCNGEKNEVFSRCHPCKSSSVMREKNRIIASEMAKRFGRKKGVIGWQLDNEIFPYSEGCFCELCQNRFKEYLKNKYKTIENLNKKWGMYRWSLDYKDFAEIIPPRFGAWPERWQHPSLQIEWFRFNSENIITYLNEQADAIRQYSDLPIGTDMMPGNAFGYYKVTENLDVVQYNHYDTAADLPKTAFSYDFLRAVKDKPFWVTETQVGWNGSVVSGNGYRPQGNCYVNTWLPIAKGAEMNLYWLFRTHPNGHELAHGALYASSGRMYHVSEEVKKAAAEFEKCSEFLNNTAIKSKIALHYSETAALNFRSAPIIEGFDYRATIMDSFHEAFRHYNIDVIDTPHSLEGYDTVISPFLTTINENGLKERMLAWVENGGTWIVGPMSDIMDDVAGKCTTAPFYFLEDVVGVYTKYQLPIKNNVFKAKWNTGEELSISLCYDAFEPNDCNSLAKYDGYDFDGYTVVAEKSYGKGKIILLGSVLSHDALRKLVDEAPIATASKNINLTQRSGDKNGVIAVETDNKEGYVVLEGSYLDLISGRVLSGKVDVKPYEVLVLEKQ